MTRHFALCMGLVLWAASAPASTQDVRLLAIGIDSSASKAEAEALGYAKKRAVYLVARKLPIENPSEKVAALTADDFAHIVRGATVMQTKRMDVRTYADVTVTVVDSELMRVLGVSESDLNGGGDAPTLRGVLVLPVYIKSEQVSLWEKDNALRVPLQNELLRQAHGGLLQPSGDLDDLRLIDHENALTVTGPEMGPMFTRYGAEEIVVAIYHEPVPGKAASPIILRRLTPKGTRSEVVKLPTQGDAAQTGQERMLGAARVIAAAALQIAASSAEEERARLAKATKIPLAFLYANPRELATMQEAVRQTPGVLQLEIPQISLGGISGVAYFEGVPQKLRESLTKAGIIVRQNDDSWQLSFR